jgi:hypothetical protein
VTLESVGRASAFGWPLAAVAVVTALGFALRIASFDQGLFGDELSTYWLVRDHAFGSMLSLVHSDAEITPPLYFIVAWLASKLGSAPDLIRLPSLIAGTATIPLVYALGARTVGRVAGAIAATVVAFSPFMVYYSTEARGYAVMIALVTLSTLALLAACESGRARWWVAYAVCSALAMYTHYTAAFPLAAQALWVLWAHPHRWRAMVLANIGAVILFAPWTSGLRADLNSPTNQILSALEPFNFPSVRHALGQWAVGDANVSVRDVPGTAALVLIGAGFLAALLASLARAVRWLKRRPSGLAARARAVPDGIVLVFLLALASPVGEALYSAISSTSLFGARNLNPSWPGLALAIGTIVAGAGPVVGVAAAVAIVGGYAVGATKTLEARYQRPNYPAVAAYLDGHVGPRDSIVDGFIFSPSPVTGLDVYLDRPHLSPGAPSGRHPRTGIEPIKPVGRLVKRGIRQARGGRLFEVTPPASLVLPGYRPTRFVVDRLLPRGSHVTAVRTFPGVVPLMVLTIRVPRR